MDVNIHRDYADVNGTRLYFETAGSGPAVVLIHGFALDTRMWDDQFMPLAQLFRVVRYDLRGFGMSNLPTDEPYSHSDDLGALLDHLKIAQAHLVGLSKGGGVILDFALANPTRVASLVLIDTVIGGFEWSAEASARSAGIWGRGRDQGVLAAKVSWLRHPLFEPAQRQPQVASRLAQMVEDYSGWHFVNNNPEQVMEPPALHRLSELAVPVLAIVGENDIPDIRQITELVGEGAPRARTLVVPEVGHMSNMEAPEEVTEAVSAFLAEL
jgi:3-oxoadipate enol-lactonase